MVKRLRPVEFDEIGYWSQVKLDILGEYAKPYNEILKAKKFTTVYIDAFAGAGHHISKDSGELIQGSPVRALGVRPPFDFLHFVDMDHSRTDELRRLSQAYPNLTVHSGDANSVLLETVFPTVRYDRYQRGLCILDPYGLHLDWGVIEAAGNSKAMDIFLNFPVMDMNMNVFWHDHERVDPAQRERMNRFWGDDSWVNAAYSGRDNLFGHLEKQTNEDVVDAFCQRLKDVAGFKFVPRPIPMRNTRGATVYYLFFAAQQPVASAIVTSIFNKYRNVGSTNV